LIIAEGTSLLSFEITLSYSRVGIFNARTSLFTPYPIQNDKEAGDYKVGWYSSY